MANNHTRGPWYWGKGKDYAVCKDIGDRCHDIAIMCDWAEETEANARLMAAAPDLLAALESIERTTRGLMSKESENAIARAAIAKATGEQP